MATPGEMVKRVAELFKVPEATVTLFDRHLAEAGLRTKGGRGRSAAKMSSNDIANLLIAVAGSSMVKDAVQTTKDYAALPISDGEKHIRKDAHSFDIDGNPPPKWDLSAFPIPRLQSLSVNHTFQDALAALIEAAADGSLDEAVKNLPKNNLPGGGETPNLWSLDLILWGPTPQAGIRIACPSNGFVEKHHYSTIPSDVKGIMTWLKQNKESDTGDLRQIREFSSRTIFAMGDLLKS